MKKFLIKIIMSITRVVLFVVFCSSFCAGNSSKSEDNGEPSSKHIFHDPNFWHHFETQIRSKFMYGNFRPKLLLETFDDDIHLYSDDDVIFKMRRLGAMKWIEDKSLWIEVVLGACKERADQVNGRYSKELRDIHVLEAFEDYVDHLDHFQQVASVMAARGEVVNVFSQNFSEVHDIDKLDPVMLVSYSERFEDHRETSVWNICVERHTRINPHHQAHCVWQQNGCSSSSQSQQNACISCSHSQQNGCLSSSQSKVTRDEALKEMVCDKVSRRLQFNLEGRMSDAMWDVELEYFKGIPDEWIEKAAELMRRMKGRTSNC